MPVTRLQQHRNAVPALVTAGLLATGLTAAAPASASAVVSAPVAITKSNTHFTGTARFSVSHGTPTSASGHDAGLVGNRSKVFRQVRNSEGARVTLFARGQACQGDPIVSVAVDHRVVATVRLASGNAYRTYTVGPSVRAGSHVVSLRLKNDLFKGRSCDRNAFVAGFGLATIKPGSTSTGAPQSAGLKRVHAGSTVVATNGSRFTIAANGRLTINRSGVTISGYDITGIVSVPASHVTVTNTVIRGMSLGSVTSGWTNTRLYSSAGSHNVISYSTVRPDPHLQGDDGRIGVDGRWLGLGGGGFTADHVDVSKAIDLVQTTEDNVTVQNSWLHDNTQYAAGKDAWLRHAFPQYATNPSHSDGWQAEGGSNLVLRGNNFDRSTPWTALIVTQNVAKTNNITVVNNWLGGGSCTINLADNKNRGASTGVKIDDNVFTGVSHQSNLPGCHIISKYQTKTSTVPTYRGLRVSDNASTDGYNANLIKRG